MFEPCWSRGNNKNHPSNMSKHCCLHSTVSIMVLHWWPGRDLKGRPSECKCKRSRHWHSAWQGTENWLIRNTIVDNYGLEITPFSKRSAALQLWKFRFAISHESVNESTVEPEPVVHVRRDRASACTWVMLYKPAVLRKMRGKVTQWSPIS